MRILPTLVRSTALLSTLLLAHASPVRAQAHQHSGGHPEQAGSDSAAVVATITAFHEALASGDTARVEALLSKDVRVLEGGGLETREEYLSHHLPGDMTFAAAVDRERGPIAVTIVDGVAWAVSSSRTSGTFREREIDAQGVELMVLSREDDEWRIRAIHWSSRQSRR